MSTSDVSATLAGIVDGHIDIGSSSVPSTHWTSLNESSVPVVSTLAGISGSLMGQINETIVSPAPTLDFTQGSNDIMNLSVTSMFNFEKELTQGEIALRIFGAIFCVMLIASTIFGNTLVIIVVVKFHRMRSVTNILLASLAIADITVAIFVMPFLVMVDLIRMWPFGYISCHLWISCDVMCCTASILHLCAIAIDR